MPEGYENRRIGAHWGAFHRSLPLSLRLFNLRWGRIAGPYQHTRPDGTYSGDKSKAEIRDALRTMFANNAQIGFHVRVRGTPPTQDEFALRRFFKSAGPAVIQAALSQLGVQYIWADEDPKGGGTAGFDCSGLTKWCYAQVGVDLPHQSELQRQAVTACTWAQARPGDLCFWGPGGGKNPPADHVGIKLNDAQIIDTEDWAKPVAIRNVGDVWIGKMPFAAGYVQAVTGPH